MVVQADASAIGSAKAAGSPGRPLKIGLVQINNSFSGQNYLPYSIALLQTYVQKFASDPGRYEFLMPLYKRVRIADAVEQFKDADLVGFSTYVWNGRISLEIARRLKIPAATLSFHLKELTAAELIRQHRQGRSLIYALREALLMVEEEGLAARHARHERHHLAFAAGIEAMGLSLLPPPTDRLWTLNTVRVPAGVDEAAIRKTLLTTVNIEVGAGLGPLAGKIWRVGLMGASSTPQTVLQFLAALEGALGAQGHRVPEGAGVAAAHAALRPVMAGA